MTHNGEKLNSITGYCRVWLYCCGCTKILAGTQFNLWLQIIRCDDHCNWSSGKVSSGFVLIIRRSIGEKLRNHGLN